MTDVHRMKVAMAENGTPGSEWMVGMHAHFGQTGEYRGGDVYRLLGDQRQSFDLAGTAQPPVVCHEHSDAPKA